MFARIALAVPMLALVMVTPGQGRQSTGAPETFTANLDARGPSGGAAAAMIEIELRRYTPEAERTAVETALRTGGYPAFLTALRKAPEVGAVTFATRRWPIRWARENPSGEFTRRIVVVTDQPIFFVGGGRVDPKPREGYEVALIEMEVDTAGFGKGMMTAAARVKPGGEGAVVVDDYADKPIRLLSVTRKLK